MSFIQRLRDKSGIIIAVLVVLALLSFLLQDAFVGSSSHLFKKDESGVIAKIDEDNLYYKDFDNLYQRSIENYKRSGINVDDQMRYNLLENIWQQYINEKLLAIEAKKNGLEINKNDIAQIFWGENVPLFLREQLTKGHPESYDKDQIKRYFAEMQRLTDKNSRKQEFIRELINPLSKRLLNEKCVSLFQKAIYSPLWLKRLDSIDASQRITADIVFVSFANSKDSSSPSSEDLQNYLTTHKPQYEIKNEERTVNLLLFKYAPTSKDSALIFNKLAKLSNAFAKTQDITSFLLHNASATTFENIYFKTNNLLNTYSPETVKKLLNIKENQVLGPYQENGYFQLARLVEKRNVADSVFCRHILISTHDPSSGKEIRADSVARFLCDSLRKAIAKGADFTNLAKQWSADEGSKERGGNYGFSYEQYGQLAPEFAKAIFWGKVGDKKIVKTNFGYHYIEVLRQNNIGPAYQFAFLSKKIIPSKHTTDSVFALANQEQALVKSADKMYVNKNSKGIPIPAHILISKDYNLPLAGFARPIIKWAFQANKGAVSEIYPIGNYYVFMGIVDIREKNSLPKQIPQTVLQKLRNQQAGKWLIEHTNSDNLETIAKQYSSEVQHLENIYWNMSVVPTVGLDNILLGAFFRKSEPNNKSLIVVSGNTGLSFIKILSNNTVSTNPPPYNIDFNTSMKSYLNGLKKSLNFQYLRDKFY